MEATDRCCVLDSRVYCIGDLENKINQVTTFPKKIKFLSDDNELELLEIVPAKDKKEVHGIYLYRKSETKLNRTVPFTMQFLSGLEEGKLLEILIA